MISHFDIFELRYHFHAFVANFALTLERYRVKLNVLKLASKRYIAKLKRMLTRHHARGR